MKTHLLLALLFFTSELYSQESNKIREIDSLTSLIRLSDLPVQHDSTSKDYPGLGLKIKTYLTAMLDSKELKKYVSKTKTTQIEDGISKEMNAGTAFYFDKNKLMKVEEYALQGEKETIFAWYFNNDECIYHTLQSDKAESRASLLITMANAIFKIYFPKNN
jgi:hypothetical protein